MGVRNLSQEHEPLRIVRENISRKIDSNTRSRLSLPLFFRRAILDLFDRLRFLGLFGFLRSRILRRRGLAKCPLIRNAETEIFFLFLGHKRHLLEILSAMESKILSPRRQGLK